MRNRLRILARIERLEQEVGEAAPTLVEDTFIDAGVVLGLQPGELRGTGHTTHQIMNAPKGAVYVWCNDDTYYAKRLAEDLGRRDLEVRPPSWLDNDAVGFAYRGRSIVIDHAVTDPPVIEPTFQPWNYTP